MVKGRSRYRGSRCCSASFAYFPSVSQPRDWAASRKSATSAARMAPDERRMASMSTRSRVRDPSHNSSMTTACSLRGTLPALETRSVAADDSPSPLKRMPGASLRRRRPDLELSWLRTWAITSKAQAGYMPAWSPPAFPGESPGLQTSVNDSQATAATIERAAADLQQGGRAGHVAVGVANGRDQRLPLGRLDRRQILGEVGVFRIDGFAGRRARLRRDRCAMSHLARQVAPTHDAAVA